MRGCFGLLASAFVLLFSTGAGANGRFPAAQRLIRSPANADQLYLAATFGLLTSGDGGERWYYLCERAFASAVLEGDALLEVLPSGAVVSGIVQSLNVSSDCGCNFRPIAAEAEDETVADVTRTATGALLTLVRSGAAGGGAPRFRLDRSEDTGATWTQLSELPSTVAEALTVDAAPSDPSRVYISALNRAGTAALFVSDDGGRAWQERVIPGADAVQQPYIAAVHPSLRDAVYLRTDGWDENDEGLEQADDALLYSSDAGQSWRELIRRAGKLFGFALADGGASVFVGYGDPVQAVRVTLSDELGIYHAKTSDFVFQHVLTTPVSCLTWSEGRLDACFEENHPELDVEFTVGFADPANLTQATTLEAFTPLLRLADVRGPLGCVAEVCREDWTTGNELALAACARLNAECAPDTTQNVVDCAAATGGAGTAGASVGGSGGFPGEPASGGTSGPAGARAGGGGAGVSGAPVSEPPKQASSSCGCRTPARGFTDSMLLFAFVLFAVVTRRRTRKRSIRSTV